MPFHVRERPDNAVLTATEVQRSTCRPVQERVKIKKAVFPAVEALCGWWNPVYVRERPDNAVLSSEEVL